MSILLKSFAFILLFSLFNCTCTSSLDDSDVTEGYLIYYDKSASASSCHKRAFNETEVGNNAYKCCYEAADCSTTDEDGDKVKIELNICAAVTKSEYNQISEVVKQGRGDCSILGLNAVLLHYLIYI